MKFGVIGCGGIADRRTIPGMLKSKKVAITVVEDVSEELAQTVAKKYGIGSSSTNEDDLLRDDNVEAVYIGTPVWVHGEQIRKAADAGKHILCEKPLAISIKETEKLIDYCEMKNVVLQVGFIPHQGKGDGGFQGNRQPGHGARAAHLLVPTHGECLAAGSRKGRWWCAYGYGNTHG